MRWTVAIAVLGAACSKPPPTQPAASTPAAAAEDLAPPSKGPLAWHTLAVGDTEVQYATIGEPREGGPVLVALPPGPQTREMVVAGLERWADAIEKDGWFVLSPVSPAGLFHSDSAALLPKFLDAAAAAHAIPADGFAVFGMSNGGLSAFAIAIEQPQRFSALVTMPGRPIDADMGRLDALAGMPVTMIVGADDDAFWITGAQSAMAALESAGGRVTLELLPDTGHAAHLGFDWPALRAMLAG